MTDEFDHVVVGAGMSALALLADGGTDPGTCVLDVGKTAGRPGATAATGLFDDERFWRPWTSDSPDHFGTGGLRRGWGGRGRDWRGMCVRIADDDLATWPAAVAERLSGDGPGSYGSVEQRMRDWAGPGFDQPRSTAEAATIAWLNKNSSTRFGPACLAVRASETAPRGWEVWQPTPRPGYSLVDGRALALAESGGRFTVTYSNGEGRAAIRARGITLAAGTIENVRLARTLLGTSSEPAFGAIRDSLKVGFMIVAPRGSVADDLDDIGGTAQSTDRERGPFNLFAQVETHGSRRTVDIWCLAGTPCVERNYAFAADDDCRVEFRGGPAPASWLPDTARQTLTLLEDELVGAVLGRACPVLPRTVTYPEAWRIAATVEDEPLVIRYYTPFGGVDHEYGGLPVGGELVDECYRLREYPEVGVAGPVTFPHTGGANSALTILATVEQLSQARR